MDKALTGIKCRSNPLRKKQVWPWGLILKDSAGWSWPAETHTVILPKFLELMCEIYEKNRKACRRPVVSKP
jgi:hypothetical protein